MGARVIRDGQASPRRSGKSADDHTATRGVSFRVWAPHAEAVFVAGDFNGWSETADAMASEGNGYWSCDVPAAMPGQQYRYLIRHGKRLLSRVDPYARALTNSTGNGIIHECDFDWGDDAFVPPPLNELVLYELHVGSFHRPDRERVGTFGDVIAKLDYLVDLGVNALQLLPVCEFAGDLSGGYNPAHFFAIESAYGAPDDLRRLVREAHFRGVAVIADVIYNHGGPQDLSLWRFDGWHEGEGGGIYFYNDWRASTDWGPRLDFTRPEVRQFIRDNVMMWLEEYRFDGLRWDGTAHVRRVDPQANQDDALEEGWTLMQWINDETAERFPRVVRIAEDLGDNADITKPTADGGLGFHAQWDNHFNSLARDAVSAVSDADRDMQRVVEAVTRRYNGPFEAVLFSESHDCCSPERKRLTVLISEDDPYGWFARKRSALAAAIVMTCPGVPMILQGQELGSAMPFDAGSADNPLDWSLLEKNAGLHRLYRQLIRVRRNLDGCTGGLGGPNVEILHANNDEKVVAYQRWGAGGPRDTTVIVGNFADRTHHAYRIGLPRAGVWKVRFNSDSRDYGDDFGDVGGGDVTADAQAYDDLPCSAVVAIGPYSVLVLSQDE